MSPALLVSNLLLWAVVLGLAVLVLALMRQVGVLHERVAPAGALMDAAGPRVGEAAPVMEVESWSGRPLRLGGADPEGVSTLLFFLSPSCPVCKSLLPVLASLSRAEGPRLRIVLASDGEREAHEAFLQRHRLDPDRYVLSTALGMAWQVGRLPYAALVDEAGIVRGRGLVNTREHLESLFEARERGVGSVQEWRGAADLAGGDRRVA